MSSGFFTSIGKAKLGIVSVTYQTGDFPAAIDTLSSRCLWELMV